MRGQGQAALGPVGGAESVEGPGAVWQDAPGPAVAVTPPPIPERAQIALGECVAVELAGQQSADTEQTGEQRDRLGRLAKTATQLRQKLGEPTHGPTVLLIAQRGEEALPKRLLPSGAPGDGSQRGGLALEPHTGRLAKQVGDGFGREVGEWRGALALDILRRLRRRLAKRVGQLAKRGVELVPELDHR